MAEKENIIREKSFRFALRIIKLYQHLVREKKEYVMSKQILRSGTAVGAMIEEALHGESRANFVHKLGMAQGAGIKPAQSILEDNEEIHNS